MSVWPLTFNELLPCCDISYVKNLLFLDISGREDLERHFPPPPEDSTNLLLKICQHYSKGLARKLVVVLIY